MSTQKGKVAERVDDVVQAEDIAASLDEAAERAVEESRESETTPELVDDALDAAAMVAEGGPVAEAPDEASDAPAEHDDSGTESRDNQSESDDAGALAGDAETGASSAEPAEEVAAESLAVAALRYGWAPVADPPELGPGNPSPDGTSLAFLQTEPSGETRLWFYGIDNESRRSMALPFVPVVEDDGPQWSPDGAWLAMSGSSYAGGPTAIWLVPVDGGDCVAVANHSAIDRQPRWSPDGSLIAFVSQRDGRDSICVALPSSDGPVIHLTWGPPGQNDREPTWSDDSTKVAFLRQFIEGEASGDHVWTVSIADGETKQATKKVANRHALRWNPGKSQVGFITDEGEWLNVGVVNPDNSAGWNLASEAGDKDDPRYNKDGSRMLYTRGLKGEVRLGERATSGASAELIDPGMGVASAPRWLPGKRVVYRFAPATGAAHFIVQDAKKDVERTILPAPIAWDAGRPLILPTFIEFEISGGAKLGGLLYRDPAADGITPGVLVLGADPSRRTDASFRPLEQALAAAGFAVFAPTLPGSPGLGKKIQQSLRSATSAEAETLTVLDVLRAMRELEMIDSERVAIVGSGYGGALALVAAGSRPDIAPAVVAIDPIADWDDEFDQGTTEWRNWQSRHFGLPTLQRGRHALRTPSTYIGVVEAPLLVVRTDNATEGRARQVENLVGIMQELDVAHTYDVLTGNSTWETGDRVAGFLRDQFGPNRVPVADAPVVEEPVESDRAEDI